MGVGDAGRLSWAVAGVGRLAAFAAGAVAGHAQHPGRQHVQPTGGGTDGVDRTPRVFATPARGDRRHRLEGLRRRRMDGAPARSESASNLAQAASGRGRGAHEVVAAAWTAAFVGDADVLPDVRAQRPAEASIATVAAAGADDTQAGHPALLERRATALIPPRAGAVAWPPRAEGPPHPRSATLDAIQQYGRTRWKPLSGYHRRSLAETAMFRLKQLFGGHLKNHRFDLQTTEAYARLAALKIMTRLGMPETVPVCSTDAPVPFTTLHR